MFNLFKTKVVASHPAPPVAARREAAGQGQKPLPKPDWHQHRYPPASVGVPLYDPDALLDLHPELVYSIRLASGLPDAEFESHYLKVARNYAHFVHVLPASRAHHHRSMGGMLRHGLEVAVHALRRSDQLMLGSSEVPKQRFNDEPIWRFAIFVAAIGHDVGKVVADIEVFDHTGTRRWNPFEETLVNWALRHQLNTYHPRWNEKRVHRAHEAMSAVLLSRLLDPEHFAYLAHGAREILMHVATTVAGVATNENPLYNVVTAADHASVSASLTSNSKIVDGMEVGISPSERFIDTVIRLLHEGWQVNQPGARVLVDKEHCYLQWPNAYDDIKAKLEREGVSDVFTTSDYTASLLIDSGMAVVKKRPGGGKGLYHRIAPVFPNLSVKMAGQYLKLARPSLVFEGALPAPIVLEEIDDAPSVKAEPVSASLAPSPVNSGADAGAGQWEPATPPSTPMSNSGEAPSGTAVSSPASSSPPAHAHSGESTAETNSAPKDPAPPTEPAPSQDMDREARRNWLLNRGAAGQAMLMVVEAINNGQLLPGKTLFVEKTDLLVNAAVTAKAIGTDIKAMADCLAPVNVLVTDSKANTTMTVRHATPGAGSVSVWRFAANASRAMRALIEPSILAKLDGEPVPPKSTSTNADKKPAPQKPQQPQSPELARQSDAQQIDSMIRAALAELVATQALPDGVTTKGNTLVALANPLVDYLTTRLPGIKAAQIYSLLLNIASIASADEIAQAGFPRTEKAVSYTVKP